ncbi:DUF502 domain-containing protein [Flavihumibacter sp. R14]|nr:DUF502 domain-containing protein [Flavihumibacter soli]
MNKIFRALLNYLIKGALVVLPLGAAIFLIYWIISKIDYALNLSDVIWVDQAGNPIYIPGLGIVSILVLLLLAGIIVTNFVTEPIYNWFSRWLDRLPIFNFIYHSVKDLAEAFVGDEKKFSEPVIVEINEFGLKQIGFLTQKDLARIGHPGEVAVYFPFSYSFAGQLCIISVDKVKPLKMSAGEAMKFVVSGGVSHLETHHPEG